MKISALMKLVYLCLCALVLISHAPGALYAQAGGGATLSELEPSDDYRPDGYYEPYDFSFVKTAPASETPSPTQQPLPPEAYGADTGQNSQMNSAAPSGVTSTPPMDAPVPAVPPDSAPAVDVPEPPDFSAVSTSAPAGATPPIVTDLNGVQNPFNEQGASPVNERAAQPANVQPVLTSNPAPAVAATLKTEPLKLFVRYNKKPLRYQVTDDLFGANADKIIGGKSLQESNWKELHSRIVALCGGAVANSLSANRIDEEFERINSVLMTYIMSYGAPDFDNVVIKYKNQYFAFLGPFSPLSRNKDFRPSNPEAKYKLLRLLGGDIIKIIADNTVMFSLKPLSYCVNEIMREVANGEFYKIELLFRVMSSADMPVVNLVRPYFQLLRSKITGALDIEKNAVARSNYVRASELLKKIK